MYFVRNKEEIHLSFKNSEKQRTQALSLNLVPRLIRVCRIQSRVHFLSFRRETPFLRKFGPKNQNCQFKLEFGAQTSSNMQNSMALFTFPVLDRKLFGGGKFGPKKQNWQFKLKFGTQTNSNMQNSMALLTFSVLDWKHPFWENLVQQIKIVSLS